MCVLARSEHRVLRIAGHRFGQFRVARIRNSVSPAHDLARRSSVASQDQEHWYLRPFAARRTIKPNYAFKLTCPVNRPRSLT
jgi:hypothetical protein